MELSIGTIGLLALVGVVAGAINAAARGVFEEVGDLVNGDGGSLVFEDQPDVERIVEVAAEYGIEIPSARRIV